jgi:hypothetical protein
MRMWPGARTASRCALTEASALADAVMMSPSRQPHLSRLRMVAALPRASTMKVSCALSQGSARVPAPATVPAQRRGNGEAAGPRRASGERGAARPPAGRGLRWPQVQVVPLTVKLAGGLSLFVQVPWKPNAVLPPALITAL